MKAAKTTMNYWLTTHWPPREDTKDKFQDTGAWVRDEHKEVLKEMQPGDGLFIYETKSGKTTIDKTSGGKEKKVPRIKGKEGVIALAKITTEATDIGEDGWESFADGTKTWWRYKAKAEVINSKGFIDRPTLAKLLGYSEKYSFRGFGDQNSGVKLLTKETFDKIHSEFLTSNEKDNGVLKRTWRGGGTGEGPFHKSLKEYIAAQPAIALNEEGLRTIRCEFDELPTGDRIDVLLKDKDGRFVTVEVEVDCDDEELAGPLQCMKYRALIAYLYKRRVPEVRTVLAARKVATLVKTQCKNYEIEIVEIPKWPGCPIQ
jgi:hypothetical protein